jgi:hypothetical protein
MGVKSGLRAAAQPIKCVLGAEDVSVPGPGVPFRRGQARGLAIARQADAQRVVRTLYDEAGCLFVNDLAHEASYA